MTMEPLDEIKRGEEANRILTSPIYLEAIQSVKDGLISALECSAMGDQDTHNRLTIALQLLNQISRNLKTHMETGKLAAIQTDDKFGNRLKRVVGL